ncbi:MAG: hypothetical protein BGO88_04930 [Flavobacterium sp. 38-13]|uniref:hypothetical protein n=1 Tax=Flavobacterium sp. 38-13 TaxID=1896168 RepID=UPI0009688FB0|nr:hypothetical protein [Flavobacterium sp. 38-13]OJX55561.1 MAG: hypothetical protein BGO88_04930 [Flavobacterium sp. 38-13]
MDKQKIEDMFSSAINERGISEKLDGISKFVIYKWRNNKSQPSFGDKLNVLYQLGKIEIRIK